MVQVAGMAELEVPKGTFESAGNIQKFFSSSVPEDESRGANVRQQGLVDTELLWRASVPSRDKSRKKITLSRLNFTCLQTKNSPLVITSAPAYWVLLYCFIILFIILFYYNVSCFSYSSMHTTLYTEFLVYCHQ